MLDIKILRENPEMVKAGIAKKKDSSDIDKIIALDQSRRDNLKRVEKLKADRNAASAEIAKKKKAGESAEDAVAAMRAVGDEITRLDEQVRLTELEIHDLLSRVPNIPHESVPVGVDETANEIVREWGTRPTPSFKTLPHWEIGAKLGILDLEAAAKISGSGFYVLKGAGAKLQRALVSLMLDTHTANGFTEYSTPYLVNSDTMYGTGQLPKFADDLYKTTSDDLWLIPTAEVPLTNIFKQEIVEANRLPIYMVGHTPCFRREAGSAGKDTRGMIRVHQFDKVELVKLVRPENSWVELDSLVRQAEKILQLLNLHYRVVCLSSGDLGNASAKTFDLELWASGVEKYLEISSISNFTDYQARRMNCRFRDEDKSIKFVHTLNGSGLALARLVPAILENYQNADGTITIPEVLRSYMKMDIIG
jgi:seryl-tRNA synthetase